MSWTLTLDCHQILHFSFFSSFFFLTKQLQWWLCWLVASWVSAQKSNTPCLCFPIFPACLLSDGKINFHGKTLSSTYSCRVSNKNILQGPGESLELWQPRGSLLFSQRKSSAGAASVSQGDWTDFHFRQKVDGNRLESFKCKLSTWTSIRTAFTWKQNVSQLLATLEKEGWWSLQKRCGTLYCWNLPGGC